MSNETQRLQADIKDAVTQLRALRDEARVKLHLASMDARDAWQKLEPKLLDAERAAEQASKATLQTVEEMVKKVSDILGAL